MGVLIGIILEAPCVPSVSEELLGAWLTRLRIVDRVFDFLDVRMRVYVLKHLVICRLALQVDQVLVDAIALDSETYPFFMRLR